MWHWRGWRNRRAWADFRRWLADCWAERSPEAAPLLLLGPSAGWTLPDNLLAPFTPVIAVDMDPWSLPLFQWRHSRTLRDANKNLIWLRQDFMQTLDELLAQWPDAVIFFANTLGQQGLMQDQPEQTEQMLKNLADRLQGRLWFSYHDRISLHFEHALSTVQVRHLEQSISVLRDGTPHDNALSALQLVERMKHAFPADNPCKVTDHLTAQVLPPTCHRRLALLRLDGRTLHVIEAGWGIPAS